MLGIFAITFWTTENVDWLGRYFLQSMFTITWDVWLLSTYFSGLNPFIISLFRLIESKNIWRKFSLEVALNQEVFELLKLHFRLKYFELKILYYDLELFWGFFYIHFNMVFDAFSTLSKFHCWYSFFCVGAMWRTSYD